MERVALILRKSKAMNRFRRIILDSFGSDAFDDHLICSGFFQERGKYSASSCFAASAPVVPCRKAVTVVGIYNWIWRGDLDDFVWGLRSITFAGRNTLSVTKRRVRRFHWHAKIYVASSGGAPVLGIIGSSNITARAFGLLKDWNYEADVVLWNDDHVVASALVNSALQGMESDVSPFEVIVSDYSSEDPMNGGHSLVEKLAHLIEDINRITEAID